MTMEKPELSEYEKSLRTYGALGLEIHVTELDIHNTDSSAISMEALADRYRRLFSILVRRRRKAQPM